MKPLDALTAQASLTRRLQLAIATPLVLLLAVGLVLGLQLRRMIDDARWVDRSGQAISKTYEVLKQILDQETSIRGYLLTNDRFFLALYERTHPLETMDQLRALTAGSPSQPRVDELRRRYLSWHDEAVRAIRRDATPEQQRSAEVLRTRRQLMEEVRVGVAAILDDEQRLRLQREQASAASTRATVVSSLGLLAAAALVLAFLSRRQIGAVTEVFGTVLGNERKARLDLETQDWLKASLVSLAEATQGERTVDEIGQRSLARLVEASDAVVGAFFAADDGGFRRRAAHALDPRSDAPERFALGAGLPGQTAADRKLRHLQQVPPDLLPVRTGLGARAPVDVLMVPACTDEGVEAVIELGYLQPLPPRSVELVRRSSDLIAVALRSARYRERLRELLEKTQRQAEELASQQEELRVNNEELEEQTRLLEESQQRLEEQQSHLEEVNQSLEAQREGLLRAQASLLEKTDELARAGRYKSEFLANMSHELRTPLNSILILARLLADDRAGNLSGEQVKFADTIYTAGNDLLNLINDILDLSKIEAGRLDVHVAPVPLERLCQTLERMFSPVARSRSLDLRFEVDPRCPHALDTDGQRLEQILKNLLANALKFTSQGKVSLQIRPAGDRIEFAVSDTGIGIPPEQQQAIFEPFRQADGTTSRKYGGTGLGLSIAREMARMLDGYISVESAVGRGSTFSLSLPRVFTAPSSATPTQAAAEAQAGVRPSATPALVGARSSAPSPASFPPVAGPPVAGPTAPPVGPPEAPPSLASAPMTTPGPHASASPGALSAAPAGGARCVLIVEDDEVFARQLAGLAREQGFEALVATTADEGVALARRRLPAAILLDLGLPDHPGLSVLDRLKRGAATRHIPVHIISAADRSPVSLEMGAVGYLQKPVEREALVQVFRQLEARTQRRMHRILVVEDDEVQQQAMARLLGSETIETVAATTVRQALDRLKTETFDCIVMDLVLPDGTGYDLLEALADGEDHSFPPVIVYTGRALSADEEFRLRKYSRSIIVKGARSPERLLDEVSLFLHQVETLLPPERQRQLREARDRDTMLEGKRILVVEDDVRNVFALTSILEPKGAKVDIARNGREALERLRRGPPVDLVLMDVMMPEMDGLEATRQIRQLPELARLPIIALTAKAMRDDQAQCLQAGASDYIAKPIDVDKLLSLVRVWIRA